jgi:Helix-turn-helix domain
VEYIEGADLTAEPLRAATAPLFSLLITLRDVAGADRAGTPEAWHRAIRPYLTRRDHEVLAPLVTAGHVLIPNAILPFPDPPGQSLKDGLERIVAGEDDLLRDVESCRALGPTGDWRVPARDPKRWMRGLVLALAHAWRGFGPIWRQGRDRLAAEVRRVQAATDRGAQLELVAGVVPCGWVADGRWVLDGFADEDVRFRAPARGVTLLPLLTGPRAALVDYDATTLRYVGYPVRAWPVDAPVDEASLEALLGGPRARILRELDRPATNGRLAATLQTVPSAATHHVTALVSAGLVLRDRSGPGLLIRRTARGDALLSLYE